MQELHCRYTESVQEQKVAMDKGSAPEHQGQPSKASFYWVAVDCHAFCAESLAKAICGCFHMTSFQLGAIILSVAEEN